MYQQKRTKKYLTILALCILCAFQAVHAQVRETSPFFFIWNYPVRDYNASAQNWDICIYDDICYIANQAGLLVYDGNNWTLHTIPGHLPVHRVTVINGVIYSQGEQEDELGEWTRDEFGNLNYRHIEHLPENVFFRKHNTDVEFELSSSLEVTDAIDYGDWTIVGTRTSGLYAVNEEGRILQHISINNGLQDNVVRALQAINNDFFIVAFDNGLSIISIDPPMRLVGTRAEVGKLQAAQVQNDTLYIRTNLGYFKRSISTFDQFVQIPSPGNIQLIEELGRIDSLEFLPEIEDQLTLSKAQGYEFYTMGNNYYWIFSGNQTEIYRHRGDSTEIVLRIYFENFDLTLPDSDKRTISLNTSLSAIYVVEGVLLLDAIKLMESTKSHVSRLGLSSINYSDHNGEHQLPLGINKITLPYNYRELSLMVETRLSSPNHQISYKIDEFSDEWSEWKTDGRLNFHQFPSGKYQLQIRQYATIGDSPIITIPIEITKPWYNTLWFYLALSLLLWLFVMIFIQQYTMRLKRRAKTKIDAKKAEEEQKVQQLKNEMLESELQNKNNELTLQASSLIKKNHLLQMLLEELDRQKEELKDRYPNKLYHRLRNLMEQELNDQDSWVLFESYFNMAHHDFMEHLRNEYSDITPGDLRICCLLRMNLTTKEIASLMNISVRAVELRRYRLRKRLNLDTDTNLIDFLMKF